MRRRPSTEDDGDLPLKGNLIPAEEEEKEVLSCGLECTGGLTRKEEREGPL